MKGFFVVFLVGLAVVSLPLLSYADNDGQNCDTSLEVDSLPFQDTADTSHLRSHLLEFDPSNRVEVKGKWYHVKGNNSVVKVSTDNENTKFDTFLAIYLKCDVTSAGYFYHDLVHTSERSLVFYSDENLDYYVIIGGLKDNNTFHQGIMQVDFTAAETPAEDVCENAIEITEFPFTDSHSTIASELVFDSCESDTYPGVWYHVVGTGGPITAHTCDDQTDYDTTISVHNSCSNSSDSCVDANDDSCGTRSVITFNTKEGQDYYIFVSGASKRRGYFVLSVLKLGVEQHGYCTEAVEVKELPFTYHGSTKMTPVIRSNCQGVDRRGLWFHLGRVTTELIAMTCDNNVGSSDTVIDVYSDCDQTERVGTHCTEWNDDYCGLNAAVVLSSSETGYYIFVAGMSLDFEGQNFTLTIQNNKNQTNDVCPQATRVSTLPVDFSGNTKNLKTPSRLQCGQQAPRDRHGAWFSFVNRRQEDRFLGITTCNSENILRARIELFIGCGSCVTHSVFNKTSGCTTLSFTASPGVNYTIFVTAEDGEEDGFFHVDFFEDVPNENYRCDRATVVDSLPYHTLGYTSKSNASYSDCHLKRRWQGMWYNIKGTGKRIRAATVAGSTHFDSVLELHSSCPHQAGADTCLEMNDDSSYLGLASSLEWNSTQGYEYRLFVRGYDDEVGLFALDVFELTEPSNSKCSDAQELKMRGSVLGVTTYAEPSVGSCVANEPRRGVWYRFNQPDNSTVVLSTCNEATTFETDIEIYGTCSDSGADDCIDHTHYKCTLGTVIVFTPEPNKDYFVFVTGNRTDLNQSGFFRLTAMVWQPPSSSSAAPSSSLLPVSSSQPSVIPISPSDSSSDHGMEVVEVLLVIFVLVLVAVIIFTIVCCFYKRPARKSYFQMDVPDGLDTNQTSTYVAPDAITPSSDSVTMNDI